MQLTQPGKLQLPTKRVIEGTIVEPVRIEIVVDASALKNFAEALREVEEVLRQMARATVSVRPVRPFEHLDKGAIDL